MTTSLTQNAAGPGLASATIQATTRARLASIDALRGIILLTMLIDHVRETFFLHQEVADPVDYSTPVGLYLTRMITEPCAPLFVFLTGLSAWLYAQSHDTRSTRQFLLRRGLFLMLLEITLVDFAWSGEFPPRSLNLQVIWCIGVSMIVLACLLGLSRTCLLILGTSIICGHNLLDGISIDRESAFYLPWAMLHERASFEFAHFPRLFTSYPLLPWFGVIILGYATGPLYASGTDSQKRISTLFKIGAWLFIAFVGLRYLNVYGEKSWVDTGDWLQTLLSFKSATKYPPSLMYLLPSLAFGLVALALLEKYRSGRSIQLLAIYGGAPMFFYLLHLYALKALYLIVLHSLGPNMGSYYGFERLSSIWICSALLSVALFFPTSWFARLKHRRRDIAWLRYF
ncbi:DUF1624 domain-containing protein [Phytopseudomonas daroniae]|uniref:DUF1624 domain-containing protein n=1 Tax=Phytopseudomonas daroniae TaxID=2487519 RepID=UPI00103832CA|nr:heparan-alpha-glucosaminide N-acetyltransferase domain-containing protein [Pseudomonas daroniae]TBU72208.1 hypothetical protein DNK10_21920 [Pseudomonas daroniae]